MPLLTTTTKANARIAELGQTIASHLSAAAYAANQQASVVMSLDNDDLATWLNEQGTEAEALFAAHAGIGSAINAAATIAHATLAASGIDSALAQVDTRPVSDKLSAQGREIVMTEQGATVVNLPDPEPEPDPETPAE